METGKPVSQLCNQFTPLPQILKNVRYAQGTPLDMPVVQEAIADGESRLAKTGRLVIRPSGTEPLIRVMAEGEDEKLVNAVVSDIVDVLKKQEV